MTEFPDAPSGAVGNPGESVEGPMPPAPQPYWGFSAAPIKPSNGLGIASLIIAIVGLVLCVTVVGGVVFGVVAVVLGLGARTKVKRGEATNGGVAMTGIVLGIVATILPPIMLLALLIGADVFNGDYQHCIGYHPGHAESCDRYR